MSRRSKSSNRYVCLSPDPQNPLNDLSTMTKIMEYMALGKPIVSFELKEARYSAGESALDASRQLPRQRQVQAILMPQRCHLLRRRVLARHHPGRDPLNDVRDGEHHQRQANNVRCRS